MNHFVSQTSFFICARLLLALQKFAGVNCHNFVSIICHENMLKNIFYFCLISPIYKWITMLLKKLWRLFLCASESFLSYQWVGKHSRNSSFLKRVDLNSPFFFIDCAIFKEPDQQQIQKNLHSQAILKTDNRYHLLKLNKIKNMFSNIGETEKYLSEKWKLPVFDHEIFDFELSIHPVKMIIIKKKKKCWADSFKVPWQRNDNQIEKKNQL